MGRNFGIAVLDRHFCNPGWDPDSRVFDKVTVTSKT